MNIRSTNAAVPDASFGIGEPSLCEDIAAVAVATGLDDASKPYWATSLRQIASIAADWPDCCRPD